MNEDQIRLQRRLKMKVIKDIKKLLIEELKENKDKYIYCFLLFNDNLHIIYFFWKIKIKIFIF